MQRFLGGIYATLGAAQWACGRVLMDVEVAYDSQESTRSKGLWEGGVDAQSITFKGECLL
jgi:hypothetical protein